MTTEALPFVLRQVADIAGRDAALQLARSWGGRRLPIPQKATPHLIREVGDAAAAALVQLFPGEAIDIPLGPTGALKTARRAAAKVLASGGTARQAAAASGLTERTIYNMRSRVVDDRQGRLFADE